MKWLVLWSLWLSTLRPPSTRELLTSGGVVRGVLSPCGRYQQFLSIPYATTDRQHRFQAPLPEPKWDGIFDAINENVQCPQRSGETKIKGQEDCLTLNVYTPNTMDADELLPVMVFIHGGGYFEGSSQPSILGPEYIVSKDVVLVLINYRLNIQGFLCLGIKEAPGNAGMKDQVAALKWVQRNIRVFRGDPDNVTLFGESAGASSVSFHVASPMSKGLFHRVIQQSGSSLSPWAIQYDPVHMASLLAKQMGYDTEDPYELYNIFKTKTNEELIITRVPRPQHNIIISELLYVPCVEKNIEGVEPFLTEQPYDLLLEGRYNKVSTIIGFNNQEGLLFAGMENDTMLQAMKFDKMFSRDLVFPTETERLEAGEKIRNIYMGNDTICKETAVKLSKMHGEPTFVYPAHSETELLMKTNDKTIYNYKFSHDGWLNLAKLHSGFTKVRGATHADDLFYLFQPRTTPSPQRFLEYDMIDKMTTMWTNFAKFGDPTPEATSLLPLKWHPTTHKNLRAFVIDQQLSTEPLWNSESLIFWNETYTKYRRRKL